MKKTILGSAAALAVGAGAASAAGLDRSGQSVAAIFAPAGTTTFSFGIVMPEISGTDLTGGGDYDNVGTQYSQTAASYSNEVGNFGYALIYDQPFGADISYGSDPVTTNLGGTAADLNSHALTFVGRYKFGDRFSVFAGIGVERIDAEVSLNGRAYTAAVGRPFAIGAVAGAASVDPRTLGAAIAGDPGAIAALGGQPVVDALELQVDGLTNSFAPAGGYQFEMEQSTKPVYLVGAAYEIPSIAMRISGTYRFETSHSADTVESFGTVGNLRGDVDYVTPQSFNLEAQTGIAPGTLLTLGYRWSNYEAVDLVPDTLQSDLVNLDDGERFTIGLGRQFNEKLAGSVALIYEPKVVSDLVSPLGPTNGLFGITLGARYANGPMTLSGGINYSWLGDAQPEVADRAVASFEDNHVVGVGFVASFEF